ncbi:hypothetical protein SCHPADRAFT_130154 [Schizopora paradoxa]|uniref:Autophagy-related protein 13 n=1 Tax=Schizopora paradoxa TaxID=27342 RepID=A0A0H2S2Q2_9AGAM|nr:hypothetical protein SCHPADRAFT_130154 [Schizopora paradoxa]
MEIDVLLTVPELNSSQNLVYDSGENSQNRIAFPIGPGQVRNILLERWSCSFIPRLSPSSTAPKTDVAGTVSLVTIYEHAVLTFRSLYSLLNILPSSRVCNRSYLEGKSGLGVSICKSRDVVGRVLDFGSPMPNGLRLPTQTFDFTSISLPMGVISLSGTTNQ